MATAKDIDRLLESFVERGLPGCSLKVMQRGDASSTVNAFLSVANSYLDYIGHRGPCDQNFPLPPGIHVQNPALHRHDDAL